MSTESKLHLAPQIAALLSRLRSRIRMYVWIEGIAATLAVVGIAFWIGLALDWLLEPSREVRLVGIVLTAVAVLYVIWRYIISRVFARLADTSMAILLERHFENFHDSLLTVVELEHDQSHAVTFNRDMLAHTAHEAAAQAPVVRLGEVFNPRPLWRNVTVATLLLASIIVFGLTASDAMAFYMKRIGLSDQLWPRVTRLVVDGFEPNEDGLRMHKIARGASYTLSVRADNRVPFEVPARVEIRSQIDDGTRGGGDARRIGEAVPGRDDFQQYEHIFKDIFESQTFDVIGGDDRVRDLRLEVVDSPEIVGMSLVCKYPEYMSRGDQTLAASTAMQLPLGTHVTIVANANKPLEWVKILNAEGGDASQINVAGQQDFSYEMGTLKDDRLLYFVLRDHDGIETPERDRYRLSIGVVADEPPRVAVALRGIGTAVTPQARMPIEGTISDDYGISKLWFEHQVGEAEPAQTDFGKQASGQNEIAVEEALELESLDLKPEQKLLVSVVANDRYDLGEGPNVGASQRFLLDVVTPERLRALLENRELQLRQRFEIIFNDMRDTRDLMTRIDFADDVAAEEELPEDEVDEEEENPPSDVGGVNNSNGSGDSPTDSLEAIQKLQARRKLRIVRSLQNVQRSAHEVLSVATAFDEIREELINNRVDTEELKRRLSEDIAQPLRHIAGPMISDLESKLEQLDRLANDTELGPEQLRLCLTQADAVLVEMKIVLDKMLELENYNEVLDTLREIIDLQNDITGRTREQQKADALEKLRGLQD